MRIIRLALISFVFLFLVVAGISLFIPSHIRISRAIDLRAANSRVMEQISEPAQWKTWYPGLDSAEQVMENGMVKGYRIRQKATIFLTGKKENEVTAEFSGERMRPIQNVWKTTVHQGSDSLTLQWYMNFHLRWYPWEKFASLILEKSYGPRMEAGLGSLKKQLEN
jgi:hypothetical protein